MIEQPKKERRFLKTLGRVGEIILEKVLIRLGSNLIKKIGGKKPLPSILFLFLSISLFAQYPNTGNKQRLGFQTTGDGLVWRGSLSDTASIQPINNQNAWVILDTVNLKIYSFDFTSNVWNVLPQGTTLDTTSLSNRINLKVNISDTASMLLPYAKKSYVDTAGRFYARQDFSNVQSSTLTWTQTDTLVPAGVNVVQVYRNGQILLPSQYTIPTKTSVVIAATSYKVGENYTVIFPKGGGGAGSGGSGSLTSISAGTGIIVSPDPITTTGTVSANLNVLMELSDTSLLNLTSRFATKLNISDTAAMLLPYATKEYADTSGRFYARQEFRSASSSTLAWTQSDTLVVNDTISLQVYRNGQILLPNQYTVPTTTSVVIAASSFKIGDNYTVILPRGGGAGSGGGSGSLTSISGGTGILVSPNPITTTGTVSADLSVLMELTDTSLLNLTSRLATKLNISDTATMLSNYNTRINSKLNISDTLSMLAPYFRDADTSSLNLTSRFALKLNAADTASLSNRINAKGTGTVTSVATGYGLSGGTITSTGTLVLDSAVVFSRIRDSIVDVAIGNDTIKILKQEYTSATTSVLTWTVTNKFPIQLKAYILVFRNGQLLINDQYNLTDTNKITIVSNSFKVGANYTVVTVSGIGSVGTGTFPNPVYPEAGIALSTGSAWASSIPNNSSNWNIAFNDKINNAAFSGTTTKTLTLTQYDGGTLTAPFTDLQGIVAADTASMLTPYLRKADTSLLNLNSRFATKLNISDTASMLTNYLRSGVAANTYLPLTGGTISGTSNANNYTDTLLNVNYQHTGFPTNQNVSGIITNVNTNGENAFGITSEASTIYKTAIGIKGKANLLATGGNGVAYGVLGEITATAGGGSASNSYAGYFNNTSTVSDGNHYGLFVNTASGGDYGIYQIGSGTNYFGSNTSIGGTLGVTGNITEGGNNVLTNLDTASLSNRIDLKLNKTDTASLSSRIDGKVSLTATETIGGTKTFNNLVNIGNQMTISGSASNANILLGKNTSNNGVADITLGTGFSITSNVLNVAIPTERYYFDLGIIAGAADNSASTYDFTYGSNIFIVPTSLNGYCIDSIYIRAIGCSTCPPVAGDKDYYVGVYKANAGARVTTSGATLVGSQITMNEYDLNEVNRNDTLSTGEAWWVYLNGTYTSDMAYVTAGFIVKKTCN